MAESNKVDKDKVDDAEFLEYLNNVNEYIFAVNNYAQAMEDGNLDRFTQVKEDIDRYGKLIRNYVQTEVNN